MFKVIQGVLSLIRLNQAPVLISVCVCVSVYSPTKPAACSQTCSSWSYTWWAQAEFVHQVWVLVASKGDPRSPWTHETCFFVLPHMCSTDSQGHLVNPRSPTLLEVKSAVSSIRDLSCPPSSFQSLSSASIFNQLSSTEGMRGLFPAFSFTHYLAADSRTLLIP